MFATLGVIEWPVDYVMSRIQPDHVKAFADCQRCATGQRKPTSDNCRRFIHLSDQFVAKWRHQRINAENDNLVVVTEVQFKKVTDSE